MIQHTKPCGECPFRKVSPLGYLGGNIPQNFAFLANREGNFECHLTMGRPNPAQCAGRATMWANQCKKSRDTSVPVLTADRDNVFGHIGAFVEHHKISITPQQLMGLEPLDEEDDPFDYEFEEEE